MIMPKNYTLQNASNLGWLFYKDYYRQEPNVDFISTQGKESDTTADFFRKTNQRITAYQLNSESPLVAAFNNHFGTPLQLKTIYPGLITGSGLPHQTGSKGEFKLGFQFDYTTGLPITISTHIDSVFSMYVPLLFVSNILPGANCISFPSLFLQNLHCGFVLNPPFPS